MKVILLENVENIGLPGQEADVAKGYFRNFLAPRGLALEATPGNIKALQSRREHLKKEAEKILRAADALGERLTGVTLTFTKKVGDNNRLYGSVAAQDVADRLREEGYEVERRHVALPEVIKATGTYTATVKLHSQVSVPVTVVVVGEQGEGVDQAPPEVARELGAEEPESEPAETASAEAAAPEAAEAPVKEDEKDTKDEN